MDNLSNMSLTQLMNTLVQGVLIPAILAIGSAVLLIIKSYAQKVSDSLVAKNEMDSLSARTAINNNLMRDIDLIVESAVAKLMITVGEIKDTNGDGKLTIEDISEVNTMAKKIIYKSLPDSLTTEGGVLNEIIGGCDSLNTLIDGLIEKHVVEQKVKIKELEE